MERIIIIKSAGTGCEDYNIGVASDMENANRMLDEYFGEHTVELSNKDFEFPTLLEIRVLMVGGEKVTIFFESFELNKRATI